MVSPFDPLRKTEFLSAITAKLIGLNLDGADGRVLTEILE
jgi:hypothetical protein